MKKIIIISLVVIWYQLAHCLKLIKENKKKNLLAMMTSQSLPPLTLDEFQFRLLTNMFNGIQYEKINMDDDNKLLSYQNEFSYNKMIKCKYGMDIQFATKLLFQAISVKLRSFEAIEQYNLQNIISDYQSIKKSVNDLLSIGYNIICHKQIDNLELRVDVDYSDIEQNFRNQKHQFHENVLIQLMSILHEEFSTLNTDPSQSIKGILNEYFIEIEDFWKMKQQDQDYLQNFFNEIRSIFLALKQIVDKKQLSIFDEKWGRILGEFSRAFLMLKLGLQGQVKLAELKKRGSTFYDRIKILSRQLYMISQTEKILLFSHLADSLAGIYIVAQNWIVLFEEENYAGKIKNQKNFNHYDYYIQAELENMNYKVCNFLADFQEILVNMQQIIDSLAEYTFTDEQVSPSFENYRPALDEIYQKICQVEPFECQEVFYHPFNLKKISKVINKIDEDFFIKIANLRRVGFYSDLMTSQSLKEEEILTYMGYTVIYQLQDRSMSLWGCRMCGGQSMVTQIRFQSIPDGTDPNKLTQFENTIKQPNKLYLFILVFRNTVLIVEKTIVGNINKQYESTMSDILYDVSDSKDQWSSQLSYLSESNFHFHFGLWDFEKYDWYADDYPPQLSGHRQIEKFSFGLVTSNNKDCKSYLLTQIYRVRFEAIFEKGKQILWSFKFYNEYSSKSFYLANFKQFMELLKQKCMVTTQFEQKSNAPNVIITSDDKKYYDKKIQISEDVKKWIFIEKVPEFVLYTAYKYLYPFSKNELSQMLGFGDLRSYLLEDRNILQKEIQKVICEKGATFCTFLDTPYELQLEKIAGKYQSQLNVYDPEFNFISTGCHKLQSKLPQSDNSIEGMNKLLGQYAEKNDVIQTLIDNGCDLKKTYQYQFSCGRKDRKFLTFDGEMKQHCFEETEENMQEMKREVPTDQRIPIQRDYFLLIQITQDGNYLKIDEKKIIEMGYNYQATWLKFPRLSLKNQNNKRYFITFQVFVRVDAIKHNFIGLVDSWYNIECMTSQNYFLRYNSQLSVFKNDIYQFRLEKAFQHSIQPLRLTNIKWHLGILQQVTKSWEEFSLKTECQWAQLFFPVQYQGDPQQSCGEEFSVKSLKFYNNYLGLSESCDGKKMPINSVYYLEVVFTNDPSFEKFKTVSEDDIQIARKQGYIPMNTRLPIQYTFNGVYTTVRIWVKPKANILNYRRFLCEKYIEEDDIFPNQIERDIWTRVVVESYYENNC